MSWGVFDTVDQCWIGDDKGPKLFDDPDIAQVASQVYDARMRYEPGRSRARWFTGTKKVKDEVRPKLTTLQALRRVERGED